MKETEWSRPDEVKKIEESFRSFSFQRQNHLIHLPLAEIENMFEVIFVGSEATGWSRPP